MTTPAPWTPAAAVAVADPAAVDALMAASFAAAGLRPCSDCGRIVAEPQAIRCHPCTGRNSPAMHGQPKAVIQCKHCDALSEANRSAGTTNHHLIATVAAANDRIDDLLDQNDALAHQVAALQAHAAALAAQVRAGKGG